MNEQRIREIANQSSTHAEDTVDYYSGIGADGLTWEAKILKARDLKFAELVVQDYAKKTIQGLMSDPAFVQAMDEHYEQKWAHRFD